MEPGLPVWTIKPNWAGGILERLEWLTDVIAADSSGAEQRRAVRLSPRRSVEITVNPTRAERTFLDLLLSNLGSETWLFPLWFDQAKLSMASYAGQNRINFDNTYRETGLGEYALLYYDAFTWEVVRVLVSDNGGLGLKDVLERDWPAGTAVYPLRRARLPIETAVSALTSRTGESVLQFQMAQANDYPPAYPADLIFEGKPVLATPPNYSSTIDTQHLRLAVDVDNQIGLSTRYDPVDRAFPIQSHNWLIHGRKAHAEFRGLLYWLRGRQRAVWLPTFTNDLFVSRPAAEGATNLDVEKVGLAYTGGIRPGRDVIMLEGHPARLTAMGVPPSEEEERVRIGAGLPVAVTEGDSASFMSVVRLNQDGIEIMHHTDIDGTAEVSATFQGFADTRTIPFPIEAPVPVQARDPNPCGVPVAGSGPPMSWEVRVVLTNGPPGGRAGTPRLGDRLYGDWGQTGAYQFICSDPEWGNASVSYYRIERGVDDGLTYNQRQGYNTADCPGEDGPSYGAFRMWVKGDNWPGWRQCPATRVGWGRQWDEGALELEQSNFDDTGAWGIYNDYNDPRYLA